MRIEVTKKEFVKALQIGGALAGTSRIMSILDCVKMKVTQDRITFVSTDSGNAISKKLDENVTSDGEYTICVNMKDLASYVKIIPDEAFEICSEDGETLQIKHKKGSFELPIHDASSFPTIAGDKGFTEFFCQGNVLLEWVSNAMVLASTDELRPQMAGLYIYTSGNEIGCCATNGGLLFADKVVGDTELQESAFVVNRAALKVISMGVANSETVKVKAGATNVVFSADGCSVIARVIEGRFPNFRSVIPKDNNIEVRTDKKELIDAIPRISIGANSNSMLAKLQVDNLLMSLSCEDIDLNKKSTECVSVQSNGEITIGFKCTWLMNVLNAVHTDGVVLSMKDSAHAALIKEDDESSNCIFVIMPMLLS